MFVISGADGSLIRELQRPDTDAVGSGRPSGFGAAVGKIGFNQSGGPFTDIGSCPLGDSADADATCDDATVGAPDGVPDLLVSASGVDVNPLTGAIDPSLNNDLGVAYIFDGRTGALLRKLMMPAVDRQMEVALGGDPRYGRAALSPGGMFPCAGQAGIRTCPTLPNAVAGGDLNGGGIADIIVAATDFDETPANSHPSSPCAASVAAACPSSGRVYVYYGEGIASSAPTVVDDTPDQTIMDLHSKPDGGSRVGTTLIPVGDLGRCTTTPAPPVGGLCPSPTRTADGKADFVSAGPDFDAYGFNGTGTVFLIDGSTGTIMRQFDNPEPQPVSAMGLAQNGLIQPAFGDLGQSAFWDFYVPSTHANEGGTAVGKGLVFNGDVTARERFIPFAQLNDPTPNSSGNFGASAAGIGNVDESTVQNEVMVGAIGPHAPGTNASVENDVHIFRPIDRRAGAAELPEPRPAAGCRLRRGRGAARRSQRRRVFGLRAQRRRLRPDDERRPVCVDVLQRRTAVHLPQRQHPGGAGCGATRGRRSWSGCDHDQRTGARGPRDRARGGLQPRGPHSGQGRRRPVQRPDRRVRRRVELRAQPARRAPATPAGQHVVPDVEVRADQLAGDVHDAHDRGADVPVPRPRGADQLLPRRGLQPRARHGHQAQGPLTISVRDLQALGERADCRAEHAGRGASATRSSKPSLRRNDRHPGLLHDLPGDGATGYVGRPPPAGAPG